MDKFFGWSVFAAYIPSIMDLQKINASTLVLCGSFSAEVDLSSVFWVLNEGSSIVI